MLALKDNRIAEIAKLSWQAFGKYKLYILVLIILGFLSGLLGGIGIGAIIPLFSLMVGQGSGGDNIISQKIEQAFLYCDIDFNIKYLLILITLLFILKAFILVLFSYLSTKITSEYTVQTRSNLFSSILRADWPYLLEQRLGHLETVLMTNVGHCTGLLGMISSIIMSVTVLIIYIFVAVNISFYITFITIILGLVFFLVFKPLVYKIRVMSYKVERITRETAHHVNENILGMKTVKVMFVSNKVASIGREYFNKLKYIGIKVALQNNIIGVSMEPFSLIFICIVFVFSYNAPNFNFAALVAVIYLIRQIFTHFEQLQKRFLSINSAVPYLKSVLNYEEESKKYREKDSGTCPFEFSSILEFKNINFFYISEKKILSNVNFIIKKGEMVGLIGPSGAGKTTIVDLLLRLFNPISGKILLDGKNIKDINMEKYRQSVGYVSQDIFLKNDTITNNIKFYNDSITDKEVEQAAKMANIYDFIQSLQDKFNTEVGERGVLLSGGQKQRIVIARVLARKPKLLILDEATSALDNESEVKIQKVIENLKGKMTVLVIAHRLSTVINSDRLIVLENGNIVEQGIPQELLKSRKSYFFKVYNIRNK